MGLSYLVDLTTLILPLDLTLCQEAVGGLTGQAPTVAVRDGASITSYLDWTDGHFKVSGWGSKYHPLTEVERGHYRALLTLSALVPTPMAGTTLLCEFEVAGPGGLRGVDHDVLLFSSFQGNTELLRKALTNRMVETPGAPGVLTLYDDDDVQPLLAWNVLDVMGGPVVSTVGAPSRRLKATEF